MAEDSGSGKANERPASVRRACFDAEFFSGFLGERVRALCALVEIGSVLRVSRERVRQLQVVAFQKLGPIVERMDLRSLA